MQKPHDPLGIWSNATIFMYGLEIINELSPEVECGHLGGYCNAVGIQVDEMDGGRNSWGRMTGWWQLKYFLIFTPKLGEMIKFEGCIFFRWVESTNSCGDLFKNHDIRIIFHPYLAKIPILTSIFFSWVGSTTNQMRKRATKHRSQMLHVFGTFEQWKKPLLFRGKMYRWLYFPGT